MGFHKVLKELLSKAAPVGMSDRARLTFPDLFLMNQKMCEYNSNVPTIWYVIERPCPRPRTHY